MNEAVSIRLVFLNPRMKKSDSKHCVKHLVSITGRAKSKTGKIGIRNFPASNV